MKPSARGLTVAAVTLAATLGLTIAGPHRAYAEASAPTTQTDSGLSVTILSPAARSSFSGDRPVEISAFYQGLAGNKIVGVELYIDRVKVAVKTLDVPETRGVVSFLVDSSALKPGAHRVVVRASAADAEVVSARSSFIFALPTVSGTPLTAGPDYTPPRADAPANPTAPTLSFVKPTLDGKVEGTVKLQLSASDPSGKAPYVSLFIDHAFKTLKNYAPYEFDWDTTAYTNGYHTVEAFGYNDDQVVGYAKPMRVYVNNPGGRTGRRTDLQDAPRSVARGTVKPLKRAPTVGLPVRQKPGGPPRRPSLLAAAPVATPQAEDAAPVRMAKSAVPSEGLASEGGEQSLSSPFVAEAPTASKVRGARAVTPTASFKPMPQVNALLAAVTPTVALQAQTLTAAPPPLVRMADAHLPADGLSSPFLAAPTVAAPKIVAAAPKIAPSRTVAAAPRLPLHRRIVAALSAPFRKNVAAAPAVTHAPRIGILRGFANLLQTKGQMSLLFNSTKLRIDRPIAEEGGVMFGPLRQVFEFGGGALEWDGQTKTVSARSESKRIKMTIGQRKAAVNGQIVPMENAPYLNEGRTMVPLSFLPAAMDVDVQYDGKTDHLLVTSKK